jgi:hypothetical protein
MQKVYFFYAKESTINSSLFDTPYIMARGIEGRNIFIDDEDRTFFLSLLSDAIRTGNSSVSRMMDEGERYIKKFTIKIE